MLGSIFENCHACAPKISVSAYTCGCVSCSVSNLNLVFDLICLFDVQIVPGLAAVSKPEVGKTD